MFKNINIFKSILAILIIFIPLYPKFPLASVEGTYVAIRLDDIVVAASVAIWVIYQVLKGFPVLKLKINKLFILYFLAIFASFINAYLIHQTEPTNILLLHMFRRFEYMSLFFIAISAIKTVKDLKFPYVFLLITTVLVNFYAYGQRYLSFPVISTMNEEFSKGQLLQMDVWTRVSSTFAGHYDLAAYMSVALIIIGAVIVITKSIPLKIISIIIWLSSFYILTLTASRVSTFAFWGGMCLTLVLLRKFWWSIPITLLVVFSVFNSKDLNQRLMATIPSLKNQLAFFQKAPTPSPLPTPIQITPTPAPIKTTPIPITTKITPIPTVFRNQPVEVHQPIDSDVGVARSGEIRFNVEWPRAITAFKKNYLLGTGLGSLTLATDNDYLRLLGESGILGFVTFLAIQLFFIIKTIPAIFKKDKDITDKVQIILLGGLVTMLANAVFIDVYEASKTAYPFWIMMGIYYQAINLKSKT